jgi:hypothetical protein
MRDNKNVIKTTELKKLLLNRVEDIFGKEGFQLNKNQFVFKKKISTAKIEFGFKFLDFYPSHIEYSFYCSIYLNELKNIIKEYKTFIGDNTDVLWNAFIVEGEFINELKNDDRKFKKLYTNEINTEESANAAVVQTKLIIEKEVLPLLREISFLSGFQKYFLTPQKITSRIIEDNFVLSCLLAAYLIDEKFYFEIVGFLIPELDKMRTNGKNLVSVYLLIEKMNAFVKHKHFPPPLAQVC